MKKIITTIAALIAIGALSACGIDYDTDTAEATAPAPTAGPTCDDYYEAAYSDTDAPVLDGQHDYATLDRDAFDHCMTWSEHRDAGMTTERDAAHEAAQAEREIEWQAAKDAEQAEREAANQQLEDEIAYYEAVCTAEGGVPVLNTTTYVERNRTFPAIDTVGEHTLPEGTPMHVSILCLEPGEHEIDGTAYRVSTHGNGDGYATAVLSSNFEHNVSDRDLPSVYCRLFTGCGIDWVPGL